MTPDTAAAASQMAAHQGTLTGACDQGVGVETLPTVSFEPRGTVPNVNLKGAVRFQQMAVDFCAQPLSERRRAQAVRDPGHGQQPTGRHQ